MQVIDSKPFDPENLLEVFGSFRSNLVSILHMVELPIQNNLIKGFNLLKDTIEESIPIFSLKKNSSNCFKFEK